MTEKIQHIS